MPTRASRTDLVRPLIGSRRLEKFRLLSRDDLLTLDGTGHVVHGHEPSGLTEGSLTAKLSNSETPIALQPPNRKPHATKKACPLALRLRSRV